MCGICGIADFSSRPVERATLLEIREALAHRGPDDAGTYLADKVGLGHRRLSIIDLGESGRQPLQNEDGTVQVICNGEIYNYRELRRQLIDAGHVFRSGTDVEVLVHGYEQWGIDRLLSKLRGMFAFAVWDGREEALWLVRDRLGVKPLFYAETNGRLLFASEARALYSQVAVCAETVDRRQLDHYLSFGYVPPDRCLVMGIEKLPPAHVLRYDRTGTKCWRYWDVEFKDGDNQSFQYHLERVDHLLQDAVTRRLESDVPLGSFLSAGIDSGLVTAIAAQSSSPPLRTFTVGFAGSPAADDERPLASMVAQRYGTQHEELLVEPMDRTALPAIIWHGSEPFADVSVLPSYLIASRARGEITVALTGDGGDESFGGYRNAYAAFLANKVKRWVSPGLRRALERLSSPLVRISLARRLNTLLAYSNRSTSDLYDLPSWWHSGLRSDLYDEAWFDGRVSDTTDGPVARYLDEVAHLGDVEQVAYVDLHLRLPGDYLTKMDIASNIVALEVRSPFLDHELVEYAATLPLSSKIYRGRQKGLLRELARKYLPEESITRRKTGFGPRLGDWLRGDWASMATELVSDGLASRPGLFRAKVVRNIVDEHVGGKRDHTARLWALVCLEVWWRMFIDKSMGPDDEL